MTEPTAIHSTIDHLIPDSKNANTGTVRGQWMLEQSVRTAGVGRGIVTDKHGNIIAGNQTTATLESLGYENVIVVPTDGDVLVVTQRNDLDLNAAADTDEYQRARTLAVADNRSGELNLNWDENQLEEYRSEGVMLEDWWKPEEYKPMVLNGGSKNDGEANTEGDDAGNGGNDETNSDDDDTVQQKPERQGQMIPLAIALTSAQLKEWNIIKESVGVASDTTAFLKLMYGEI